MELPTDALRTGRLTGPPLLGARRAQAPGMAMPTFAERVLFPPCRLDAATLERALADRTVVITGASFGIGAEVARLVGAAGARVILVARTVSRLEEVAHEMTRRGGTAVALPCDLNDPAAVGRLADELVRLAPDILVSNAGKSIRRPIMQSLDRFGDVTRTANINFLSPCRIALALAPGLLARGGQIVNVSAANVLLQPAPGWAAYQASKTAFDQWLRSAAPEWRARGMAVSTLYLPLVRTRMIAPTRRYDTVPAMQPAQAARHVAAVMLSRRSAWTPWWLPPVQLASSLARRPWERLAERHERRTAG